MKPCEKCPWAEKGQRLITEELKALAAKGEWFCCHVKGGTCFGAEKVGQSINRKSKNKIAQ